MFSFLSHLLLKECTKMIHKEFFPYFLPNSVPVWITFLGPQEKSSVSAAGALKVIK